MAEAQTLEASAAPAAPAKPASEIHVTPATVTDRGPAQPPPKPGSAKDRMFADLRKKAGEEPETNPVVKEVKTTPKDEPVEVADESEETTPTTITDEKPVSADKSEQAEPAKKGKVSPWKLVDEHKAARLKAETEIAELRKTMAPPEKLKELETKAAEYEKKFKELDEHIKYVDYTKSTEFQEKYQKPYEDAWQRWMGDLGELTVAGPDGAERPLAPQDLLELVNLPLQKAREEAEAKFGNFADDVMSARKEIRGLFDQQQRALAEAKKLGAEKMEQTRKQTEQQQEAMRQANLKLWQESNEAVVKDEKYGKFFTPVEGDEEGNTRLKTGYELADRAFSINPNDPRLTPDQRAEVVRLHAAIRNRAAAFGRVAYQKEQLEAKVAALTQELAKYKGAQPGAGEPKPAQAAAHTGSARDGVFEALRKYAH